MILPPQAAASRRSFRAPFLALSMAVASTVAAFSQVPAYMQRDFNTNLGGIRMIWSSSGFWSSAPGKLQGNAEQVNGFLKEINSVNPPAPGYVYTVGTRRELILSAGSKGSSSLPVEAGSSVSGGPSPVAGSKLRYEDMPASPTGASSIIYSNRPAIKGKPVPLPPLPQEPRVTYIPRSKPAVEKPKESVLKPAPLDPVTLPAPKPAVAEAPATPGVEINGIPPDMQKSFLSRNKSVFMIFDKEKGVWTSSPGVIKDLETADEWCKQATEADASYGRIPKGFSYQHLGSGQVQIRKD